jgi:hypothetical protein
MRRTCSSDPRTPGLFVTGGKRGDASGYHSKCAPSCPRRRIPPLEMMLSGNQPGLWVQNCAVVNLVAGAVTRAGGHCRAIQAGKSKEGVAGAGWWRPSAARPPATYTVVQRAPTREGQSFSRSCFTSSSVFSSFLTPKVANDPTTVRAICRSMLFITTPSRVTCPRSTMMWIEGFGPRP